MNSRIVPLVDAPLVSARSTASPDSAHAVIAQPSSSPNSRATTGFARNEIHPTAAPSVSVTVPSTISTSGTSTGRTSTTSGRVRRGASAGSTSTPAAPPSAAASSLAGSQVRRTSSPCRNTAITTDRTPIPTPQSSIAPRPTPRDPLTASAAAPGSTISRPTSSPMASAPPIAATLAPVRAATERAIGTSITSATSK